MSLRLVRCPYCSRRFNVAGISPGSRLRCGGCTAVLTVPGAESLPARRPFARGLQVGGGIVGGILAAAGLYFAVRPGPAEPPPPAPAPVAAAPRAAEPEPVPEVPSKKIDDPALRAQAEIYRDFGTQFVFLKDVKPYLVALERSERYIARTQVEDYAQRLELLHAAFRREYAERMKLPEAESVLTVVILNSRESFDRYGKARNASSIKGIYEYGNRRIVMYHDPVNVPYDVLLHEGLHQLVHHHTLRETGGARASSTYWFQEGMATYFEGFRWGAGRSLENDGTTKGGRLAMLKQTLQESGRKDFVPLNVLTAMSVDEFWDWYEKVAANFPQEATRKAQLYYAESWAFVHFLRHRDGRSQKLLDEYFAAEVAGRGSKETFERLCRDHLGKELSQLEEEFVSYIQSLR